MWRERKWSWSVQQRRALIVLIALGAIGFGIQGARRSVYLDEKLPQSGPRAGELADRIDPNTATMGELSTLPDLGRARATAIIAYREKFAAAHPGTPAFSRAEDLRNIKGIGPGIVQKLAPHMVFAEQVPQTSP